MSSLTTSTRDDHLGDWPPRNSLRDSLTAAYRCGHNLLEIDDGR
jgi:hypothetical protein